MGSRRKIFERQSKTSCTSNADCQAGLGCSKESKTCISLDCSSGVEYCKTSFNAMRCEENNGNQICVNQLGKYLTKDLKEHLVDDRSERVREIITSFHTGYGSLTDEWKEYV